MKINKRWILLVLLLTNLALACSSTSRLTSTPSRTFTRTARAPVARATSQRGMPTLAKRATASPAVLLTATETLALTATATQGPTHTPASSSTPTATSTVTITSTPQATNTPKATFTASKTKPNTSTATLAPSSTPTITLTPTATKTPSALLGQTLLDVTYCTMGDLPQKLDIYFPTGDDIPDPWPVVVYLHGGGWTQGDKAEGKWLANWLNPYGYMVVTVNYRMYPDFYFPAFIEDPKCAIRFLRAHAERYGLNPERIAAWGPSAGGHLVALLGTSDKDPGWDVGEYPGQSSRVQAVVDIAGPADLTVRGTRKLEPLIKLAFKAVPKDRGPYSPVSYASADDPPFFIVHGNQDDVVPLQQGQALYNALTQVGVPAQLVIAKNGTHSLVAAGKKPMTPSMSEILEMAYEFLDAVLKSP